MGETLRAILGPIASLKITVALFAMAMFLIFAGTLAQVDLSNWTVVDTYFRHVVVWIDLGYFFPLPQGWTRFRSFPFPGGYALGGTMLINLLAAHAIRFQLRVRGVELIMGLAGIALSVLMLMAAHANAFGDLLNLADQPRQALAANGVTKGLFWTVGLLGVALMCGATSVLFGKREGIVLLHAGVILMLVSEGVTGLFAVESQMRILEGQTVRYSVDVRTAELAVIDGDNPQYNGDDYVVAIPQSMLEKSARRDNAIHTSLPFDVRVDEYMSNSDLYRLQPGEQPQVTHGTNRALKVIGRPDISGTQTQQGINMPSAIVTLSREGKDLGRYLLSTMLEQPQFVEVDGKQYEVFLRFRRHYKPYSIELLDFRHDKFVGTEMARNFSSEIRLRDADQNEDRRVLIYMNHPLRYNGETFFQSSFFGDDQGSILQVVDNPGAWMPYYSCLLVSLGMTLHFGRMLFKFAGRSIG